MQLVKIFKSAEIHVLLTLKTFQAFLGKGNIPNHLKGVHILISLLPMSITETKNEVFHHR